MYNRQSGSSASGNASGSSAEDEPDDGDLDKFSTTAFDDGDFGIEDYEHGFVAVIVHEVPPVMIPDDVPPILHPIPEAMNDEEDGAIYCDDCDMWLNGPEQFDHHLIGKKHRKNVRTRELQQVPPATPLAIPENGEVMDLSEGTVLELSEWAVL